jgi:L-lactate dehydrogenase complex protein LldG
VGQDKGYVVTARDDVMARIRSATGPANVDVPRAYRTLGDHTPGAPELLDLFAERLEDYRAIVYRCTARRLASTVAAAIADRGVSRLAVPPGLPTNVRRALSAVEVVSDDPPLTVDALDHVDGVVTGCALAVAETGTIVLDASPSCGRRVLTLVPDYHLVVVRAAQVVASVPEAVAGLDPRAPLTWISGPSATSDIELSRVEGVHGPRTLAVVLVS